MPVKFTPADMAEIMANSTPLPPLPPLTVEHLVSLPYEPSKMTATDVAQAEQHIRDTMPRELIPGMLQVAENALAAHRAQVKRFEEVGKIQRGFRRNPTLTSFNALLGLSDPINFSRATMFDFIVETLRPSGLPRDGPFVWCSPDTTVALDTEDTTEGTIKMATKSILTPPGTASFLNLKEPRAVVVGGEPRYSFTLIFDKDAQKRPEFKALQVGIDEALKDKWPHKLPVGLKSPFHDGSEKAGQYEGYKAGDIFISPWSKDRPGAVNKDKQDIIDWSEFFAGWLARANVRPFAYDQGGNKGCGLFLDSVQFLRPGKRLDGRKAASESFPDDEEGEDEPV